MPTVAPNVLLSILFSLRFDETKVIELDGDRYLSILFSLSLKPYNPYMGHMHEPFNPLFIELFLDELPSAPPAVPFNPLFIELWKSTDGSTFTKVAFNPLFIEGHN